ncbi:hypothetical protein [Dysgonomonas sp. ZJ279]|uniref:hypothetical protein n=1 Tax=Dysgonomonas sp. ZJ279 TaxID=2709796 RepID=UPI0013ECE7DC|nr:hypothetical protein [Dysgonomonas sp. ZJ279]
MRKLITLLLLIPFVFACSSDDNEVDLTVTFKSYTEDGNIIPRPNSRIWIYETKGEDTVGWIYRAQPQRCVEKKDGTIIYPKYVFEANASGVINGKIGDYTSYIYDFESLLGDMVTVGIDNFETKSEPVIIEKLFRD